MSRSDVIFGMLLAMAACGGSSPDPTASIRDSAGITIQEYPAGTISSLPELAFEPEPIMVVGGAMEDDLSRITAFAAFLPDGRLALADGGQNQAVRIFDSTGAETARYGRNGEGPGEFRSLDGVFSAGGDTLASFDMMNRRMSLALPSSGVIREFPATLRADRRGFGPMGRLSDGSWLLRVTSYQPPSSLPEGLREGERLPVAIVRAVRVADGARLGLDTVMMVRDGALYQVTASFAGQVMTSYASPMFGPSAVYGVWGGNLVIADNARWELVRHGGDGLPRLIVRTADRMRPVTEAVRDSAFAGLLRRWENTPESRRGPMSREEMEAQWRQVVFADSMAVFQGLRGSPDGRLLAVESSIPGAAEIAAVLLDGDGRLLGRIRYPADDRLIAFDGDRIALHSTDDDGFVSIRVVRIVIPEDR